VPDEVNDQTVSEKPVDQDDERENDLDHGADCIRIFREDKAREVLIS
jgi:hypothetical protein